jgi:hypothetical protein
MRNHLGSRASKRVGNVCQRSKKGVMLCSFAGFGPCAHATALRLHRASSPGARGLSCSLHVGLLCVLRPWLPPRFVPCSRSIVSGTVDVDEDVARAVLDGVSRAAIRMVQICKRQHQVLRALCYHGESDAEPQGRATDMPTTAKARDGMPSIIDFVGC